MFFRNSGSLLLALGPLQREAVAFPGSLSVYIRVKIISYKKV
jgi:hypothetical protein